MNMLAAYDTSISNSIQTGLYASWCLEDDTSFPIRMIPLIMLPKGITLWVLLRTDGWNCVPKKVFAAVGGIEDAKSIDVEESRFKFSNSWVVTSEILLSTDIQKAFYEYISENEYVSFPCVQVWGLQVDVNQNVSQDVGTQG
jgi:hypothetical protein